MQHEFKITHIGGEKKHSIFLKGDKTLHQVVQEFQEHYRTIEEDDHQAWLSRKDETPGPLQVLILDIPL